MNTFTRISTLLILTFFTPVLFMGQVLFQKSYPTVYDRTTRDVWPTSDGGFLLVGAANNIIPADCVLYVMKTNGTGDFLWEKSFGGAKPDYAYSMVETHDGNYIIAGFTQSFGPGDYDMYLLKVSPDGTLLKEADIGDGKNQEAREIIRTKDNKYVVVGTTGFESSSGDQQVMVVVLNVDLGVESTWTFGDSNKQFGLGIKQTADDGFIICGQTFIGNGPDDGNALLMKISSTGAFEWSKDYGGAFNDEAVGIVVNPDGSYVWAMRDSSQTNHDVDVHIYKVDNNGGPVWDKLLGGQYKDTPKTIHALGNNEYVVGAISRSFNGAGTPDMWILKVRDNGSTGDTVWAKFYGDPIGHDHCHRAKPVSDGIVACGHTRNPNQKIYFLKLSFDGNLTVGLREDQLLSEELMVFPNPSTDGVINLKAGTESFTSVEVFNILGDKVYALNVKNGTDGVIDLSSQPAGVYVINVASAKGSVSKKIVLR